MIVVPSLALLRHYNSGKPFSPYGISVMPERDSKIAWMMVPGDLLHHWLAFTCWRFCWVTPPWPCCTAFYGRTKSLLG